MLFGVSETLRHWGTYCPDHRALVAENREVSYRELDAQVDAVAQLVADLPPRQRRVGMALIDKPTFLVGLIGSLRAGRSAAILNTELPVTALHQCCAEAEISTLLCDRKFIAREGNDEFLRHFGQIEIDLDTLGAAERETAAQRWFFGEPSDEWGILYSSGTTGIPKGIERNHYSIVTELLGWSLELELSETTHFYIGRPIFYTGGLVLCLATLLVGGSIGIDETNDWCAYQEHLGRYPADWAFFTPAQLRAFVRSVEDDRPDSVLAAKSILVMGDPISGRDKQEASRVLGSAVVESWGNSESLGTITTREDLQIRPNSIGRPFLTDRLYVVDKNGQILPPNSLGRLAGGQEAGFRGYCGRPEETRDVLQHDLIISDDIGYVDEDGYFYHCGRESDCIEFADGIIFLTDIEERLQQVEGIVECAALSVPESGILGAVVVFAVASDPETVDVEALVGQIAAQVDPRIEIKDVVLIGSLPRNAAGKVMKEELKKRSFDGK